MHALSGLRSHPRQGWVVRKLVNANPGVKVDQDSYFSYQKSFQS